jgi:hypothetical protein
MWNPFQGVFAPSDPPPAPAPEPACVPKPLSDTASPRDPPAEDDEVARKLAACEAEVREIEALEAGSAPAPAPAPTSPAARAAFDLAQAPAPASPPSSTRAPPSPTPGYAAPTPSYAAPAMKIGEVHNVWIPQSTQNEEMGNYVHKRTKPPYETFEVYGAAPYNATHACKSKGKWFKLEMGSTGKVLFMGETLYQEPAPKGASSAKSAPSTSTATSREVGGRKVDYYFHAYVSNAIFSLTNAKLFVIPAEDYGRVYSPRGSKTHIPSSHISDLSCHA